MSVNERRMEILDFLLECRRTSISEIQRRFNISRCTAIRDIQELTRSYPIDAQRGVGGGISIKDGYRLGMKYLSEPQRELLEKLSETLSGEELATMQSILKTFSNPRDKAGQ